MQVLALCNTAELNSFMYYTKNILNIIMIVAPILAIVSLVLLLFKLTTDPDNTKLIKNLQNSLVALVIIFFIPFIVTIAMSLIGDKTNFTNCYKNATKPDLYVQYTKIDDEKPIKITTDPQKYEEGDYEQLDFSCKSKKIRANFSCDSIHIVERHLDDLNYYNFNSVISAYGGFDKYMNRLGGYFKKYYGYQPKVKTVKDFQEVSEYVFGMMTMYGFDYFNGKDGKYCKWGGNCKDMYKIRKGELPSPGSEDAFYPGQLLYTEHGLPNRKDFDTLISGKNGLNMTTCCNWTVDMVFYKAGIFGTGRTAINSSASYKAMGLAKTNKLITDYHDIKPGDIVHFFNKEVDPANPNTWGDWYHVAYVGEVDKKKQTYTIYEGGSFIMVRKSHKNVKSMNKVDKKKAFVRVINLK